MESYKKVEMKVRSKETHCWIQEVRVESWTDWSKDGWEREGWGYSCPELSCLQQWILSALQRILLTRAYQARLSFMGDLAKDWVKSLRVK